MSKITITYPPDFDGELHIDCLETEHYFVYEFKHAKQGDEWATLVKAAYAILAQQLRKENEMKRPIEFTSQNHKRVPNSPRKARKMVEALTADQKREALNIDPLKCFVCQINKPEFKVSRHPEWFDVCDECRQAIEIQNKINNTINKALCSGPGGRIFEYTLGVSPLPVKIEISRLP